MMLDHMLDLVLILVKQSSDPMIATWAPESVALARQELEELRRLVI